jgi:predicted acyltransferase
MHMRFWKTLSSSPTSTAEQPPVCNPAPLQKLRTGSIGPARSSASPREWQWASERAALQPGSPARPFGQVRLQTCSEAGRAEWLDALRGITIAIMLVVNSPGSEASNYAMLCHSEWNGFTLADLVFPCFLFIVGASMALSLAKHEGDDWKRKSAYLYVLRRTAILFTLGVLLNAFPDYDISNLRIMGVLQRIALAYMLASAIILFLRRGIWVLCGILLAGYWLLMAYFPVPGFGAGDLSAAGNLAAYIDRLTLTPSHLLAGGPTEPEGLLATLPAVVNVLSGYLVAKWLRLQPPGNATSLRLTCIAVFTLLAGCILSYYFPLNKQLWTSSYTVYSTGWSLLFLSFCYYAIEIRQWRRWSGPFVAMGTNAIFVYMASEIVEKLLCYGAPNQGARAWMFQEFFSWADPKTGSFLYGVAITGLWGLVLYGMRKRSLRFKI